MNEKNEDENSLNNPPPLRLHMPEIFCQNNMFLIHMLCVPSTPI